MDRFVKRQRNELPTQLDSPEDWTWSNLKKLEQELRCPICSEFFKGPMILSCSHNFCSLCIRERLSTVKSCPKCFVSCDDSHLRKNSQLEIIAQLFQASRLQLLNLTKNILEDEPDNISDKPQDLSFNNEITDNSEEYDKQECPLCLEQIAVIQFEAHSSECYECLIEQDPTPLEKTKYLPKIDYHLLTEKKLKEELNKYDIPIHGDKVQLKRRHQHFTLLYNANQDSLKPLSLKEIVQNLINEEQRVKLSKRTKPSFTDEKDIKQHLSTYSQDFSNLINQAQKKRKNT